MGKYSKPQHSGSDFIVKQTNHASKQTKNIVKGVKECTALVQLLVKIDIANAHGLLLNRDYGNGLSGRYYAHPLNFAIYLIPINERIYRKNTKLCKEGPNFCNTVRKVKVR